MSGDSDVPEQMSAYSDEHTKAARITLALLEDGITMRRGRRVSEYALVGNGVLDPAEYRGIEPISHGYPGYPNIVSEEEDGETFVSFNDTGQYFVWAPGLFVEDGDHRSPAKIGNRVTELVEEFYRQFHGTESDENPTWDDILSDSPLASGVETVEDVFGTFPDSKYASPRFNGFFEKVEHETDLQNEGSYYEVVNPFELPDEWTTVNDVEPARVQNLNQVENILQRSEAPGFEVVDDEFSGEIDGRQIRGLEVKTGAREGIAPDKLMVVEQFLRDVDPVMLQTEQTELPVETEPVPERTEVTQPRQTKTEPVQTDQARLRLYQLPFSVAGD